MTNRSDDFVFFVIFVTARRAVSMQTANGQTEEDS
jgi:hypothetical protein